MARLIYTAIASIDGYVADAGGGFDWAAPDREVHAAVNDLERPIGTYLLGRRMYETMRVWDDLPGDEQDPPDEIVDYARIWRAADKLVYSRSLDGVSTLRTRLEPEFDPAAIRALVDAADADVSIGGPTLAAVALRAGIVDELRLFAVPAIVGGGTPWLPDGLDFRLELLEARAFGNGTTLARYRVPR